MTDVIYLNDPNQKILDYFTQKDNGDLKENGWNTPWRPYPSAEVQYQDLFKDWKKVGKVLSYNHAGDIGFNAILIDDDGKEIFLGNFTSRAVAKNKVEFELSRKE